MRQILVDEAKRARTYAAFKDAVLRRDLHKLNYCLTRFRSGGLRHGDCIRMAQEIDPDITEFAWDQWMTELEAYE